MKRFRIFVLSLVAVAMLAIVGRAPLSAQAAAPAVDPAVLAPIDAFIAAILAKSPNAMGPSFAANATIIDDVPPNVFHAPNAYVKWYDAFAAANAQQHMVVTMLAHGSPHYAHVGGGVAYVVLPTDFAYTIGGKPYGESGAWTFALVKTGGTWKITSWAWSLLTSTAE